MRDRPADEPPKTAGPRPADPVHRRADLAVVYTELGHEDGPTGAPRKPSPFTSEETTLSPARRQPSPIRSLIERSGELPLEEVTR
jgi:hypothetical protein